MSHKNLKLLCALEAQIRLHFAIWAFRAASSDMI